MPPLLLAFAAIIVGLIVLIWSADRFIDSATICAHHLGISPLVIGIVIVGFGTSAPEMIVSIFAALEGAPQLALGNAFGSNIANIGLIIGVVALLTPFCVASEILRKELPILAGVTLIAGLPLLDGEVSSGDALALLAGFACLMFWSIKQGSVQAAQQDPLAVEVTQEIKTQPTQTSKAFFSLIFSLTVLILSSRLLVWGCVDLARAFGVNELLIGLTIVAIGTSLPELAASLAAVRKHEPDIALGNIIGSNLFNMLAVVGITGMVRPFAFDLGVLYRDWPVMLGLTLVLCWFAWSEQKVTRLEGFCFLVVYVGYLGWLIATRHD